MARRRSISGPIVLSSVTVALCITMLALWVLVLVRYRSSAASQIEAHLGLMIGGVVSFLTIGAVLVLFAVFLVREIREVRRQDSFIDSVTHELKSPLASVRLALETMARVDLDPERRSQLRSMALDDVSRLSALIDGVLAASRVGEQGGRPRKRERTNLLELALDCVDVCARRHHLDDEVERFVQVEVPEDLVLMADPTSLRMVLENLVDNAIKYSEGAPQVTLRAEVRDGRVEIEVSDRGIGVKRSDLRRIFQRFYRVPEAAVRSRHGTGLGLFIVAALVRGLGGRVRASSEGPGAGTTIHVSLPHANAG